MFEGCQPAHVRSLISLRCPAKDNIGSLASVVNPHDYLIQCTAFVDKKKKKKKKKKKQQKNRSIQVRFSLIITKTRLYNFDPLHPHFIQ